MFILRSLRFQKKAPTPIRVIPSGILTSSKALHQKKASSPISVNLSVSIVALRNPAIPLKAPLNTLTFLGITTFLIARIP